MFVYRIKFESSSDSSDDELNKTNLEDEVIYFDDDLELPLFSKADHGQPVHTIIETLLSPETDDFKVCKVQPLGVMRNATFIVDIDEVAFEDLKADDLGSWSSTGTKRIYFRFTQRNIVRYASGIPSSSSDSFCLTRRYYVHKTYHRFHRIISDIIGNACPLLHIYGNRCNYMLLNYVNFTLVIELTNEECNP